MNDQRTKLCDLAMDDGLEDTSEKADALTANMAAVELIVRLRNSLKECEQKANAYREQLYVERKEYHEWTRKVMIALGMSDSMPVELVIPYAGNIRDQITVLTKDMFSQKERADAAEESLNDILALPDIEQIPGENPSVLVANALSGLRHRMDDLRKELESEHRSRLNAERKVEKLEEKIDFGVSVMGELRSLVEELRFDNLKLRQDLRRDNSEFQDLKVQYEQRESEVIALRKELKSYQGRAPVNEIDYRAECIKLQNEVERLRHLLKLAIVQEQAIGLIEKRLRDERLD